MKLVCASASSRRNEAALFSGLRPNETRGFGHQEPGRNEAALFSGLRRRRVEENLLKAHCRNEAALFSGLRPDAPGACPAV